MENIDNEFEQYLKNLTQDIIEGFTTRPDQASSMSWTEFIISLFMKVM